MLTEECRPDSKRGFFLYFHRNRHPYHRFAVSVNRRVGSSVQRNYIKRTMKELFRNHRQLLGSPHDLWVVIKSRFGAEDFDEVRKIFIEALNRID